MDDLKRSTMPAWAVALTNEQRPSRGGNKRGVVTAAISPATRHGTSTVRLGPRVGVMGAATRR